MRQGHPTNSGMAGSLGKVTQVAGVGGARRSVKCLPPRKLAAQSAKIVLA